jgi:hypothetical protein
MVPFNFRLNQLNRRAILFGETVNRHKRKISLSPRIKLRPGKPACPQRREEF